MNRSNKRAAWRHGAALALVCTVLPLIAACEEDSGGNGEFRLTYYWLVTPEDADLTTPDVNVLDSDGNVIAQAPEDLVQQIALEGSGFLEDGTLINLACACPWPDSRFEVVDTSVAPWGYDARGEPLEPLVTLAVDPDAIVLGEDVYLPDFAGLELEDGSAHDGCFFAGDTGYTISGRHIDLFAGTSATYRYLDGALNGLERVPLSVPGPCP